MPSLDAIYADVLALASAVETPEAPEYRAAETHVMAERVLEDMTATQAQWLGAATPIVEDLLAKAQAEGVSDADFIRALEECQAAMPMLFDGMDWHVLADALEAQAGTAMLNGAVARYRLFDVQRRSQD